MYFMSNIKKAGSYFLHVANILLIGIIINIIFFIAIKQEYSPEAMATVSPSVKSFEKVKEVLDAINKLIWFNLFATILIIYNLFKAAYCLIDYDIMEKVEKPNKKKD